MSRKLFSSTKPLLFLGKVKVVLLYSLRCAAADGYFIQLLATFVYGLAE